MVVMFISKLIFSNGNSFFGYVLLSYVKLMYIFYLLFDFLIMIMLVIYYTYVIFFMILAVSNFLTVVFVLSVLFSDILRSFCLRGLMFGFTFSVCFIMFLFISYSLFTD